MSKQKKKKPTRAPERNASDNTDRENLSLTSGFQITGNKLRNKIFVRVLLVSVIPFIIAGIIALYITNISHKNDVALIEDNVVEKTVKDVERIIFDAAGVLELFLGNRDKAESFPRIIDFDSDNSEAYTFVIDQNSLLFVLRGIIESNDNIQTLSLVDTSSGREAIYTTRNQNVAPLNTYIDVSQFEHFKRAAQGNIYIGPVSFTPSGPLMTIAAPVRNANNKIIGVLSADIHLALLQATISTTHIGNQGYVYIVDTKGVIVAHTTQEHLISMNIFENIKLIRNIFTGTHPKGLEGLTQHISIGNEKVFATGQLMPVLGLAVVAEWPVNDANAFLNLLRNQLIVSALFILLATALLSIFLANRIVRPIKALQQASKRISTGDLDEHVEIKTNDEIEELGIAFNQMTQGLKRLEELREEFVFVAAHELRTPVTAIKGYADMLMDGTAGEINESARKFLTQVQTASERLNILVNDLLEVARSDAGRLEIEVSPTDLQAPIQAVLDELKPLADKKKISLVYESEDIPHAMADEKRIKEVMVNLIGNAIKYTVGEGSVTITHETKDDKLITHVKDTGMGMTEEEMNNLFQKFYRVKNEATQEITGTGLGLFIVKEIIEKMNGRIWVESDKGKGSTFSFEVGVVA